MGFAAAALFLPPGTQIGGSSAAELKRRSSLICGRKGRKTHRQGSPVGAVVYFLRILGT